MQSGALAGAHAARANPGDCRPENNTRLLRGLEIGVNDYFLRSVDKTELLARARTQIRKAPLHRHHLRDNVQMAITDALTGLHNRRHLATLAEQAAAGPSR